MTHLIQNELCELADTALYVLLGDAWNAQFGEPWYRHTDRDDADYLESSADIGRREFANLIPALSHDLREPCQHGIAAVVNLTIKKSSMWRMPSEVVAALATHQGLVPANILKFGSVINC